MLPRGCFITTRSHVTNMRGVSFVLEIIVKGGNFYVELLGHMNFTELSNHSIIYQHREYCKILIPFALIMVLNPSSRAFVAPAMDMKK